MCCALVPRAHNNIYTKMAKRTATAACRDSSSPKTIEHNIILLLYNPTGKHLITFYNVGGYNSESRNPTSRTRALL